METASVLLIDSSHLFRDGIRHILEGSAFHICHEASSLEEALPLIASSSPRVILIDPQPSEGDLDRQMSKISSARTGAARVVILTNRVEMDRLAEALSAGVDGFLLKDMSADALQQSLCLVLLGEKVFPSDLAHLLIERRIAPQAPLGRAAYARGLSHREMQILSCLLNGDSNKSIANCLGITEGTVKVHIKAVLKKINVQNRTQAAVW